MSSYLMGIICGKGGDVNIPNKSIKTKGANSNELELLNKKEFQKSWEQSHLNLQTEIAYMWGISIPIKDITQVYIFNKNYIGSGHYGSVRKAKLKIDRGKTYAVKSVEKKKLKSDMALLKKIGRAHV